MMGGVCKTDREKPRRKLLSCTTSLPSPTAHFEPCSLLLPALTDTLLNCIALLILADSTVVWPILAKDGKVVQVLTSPSNTPAAQRNFSESKNVCDHLLLPYYSESLLNSRILIRSDPWTKNPSGSLAKDENGQTKVTSRCFSLFSRH